MIIKLHFPDGKGYIPFKLIGGKFYEVYETAHTIIDDNGNAIGFKDYRIELEPITTISFCGMNDIYRSAYLDMINYREDLIKIIEKEGKYFKHYILEYIKNRDY